MSLVLFRPPNWRALGTCGSRVRQNAGSQTLASATTRKLNVQRALDPNPQSSCRSGCSNLADSSETVEPTNIPSMFRCTRLSAFVRLRLEKWKGCFHCGKNLSTLHEKLADAWLGVDFTQAKHRTIFAAVFHQIHWTAFCTVLRLQWTSGCLGERATAVRARPRTRGVDKRFQRRDHEDVRGLWRKPLLSPACHLSVTRVLGVVSR